MIVPAIVGTVALLGLAGRWYRRSIANAINARFDRAPDGVIVGAEPIRLAGRNDAAVLLVHGGGDTPQTLKHLAGALAERGYTVSAPLLPGHGRDLAAFDASDGAAWYQAVTEEFERLRETHQWIGVVGLSMGGAISARLAADTGEVAALVLASPYLSMPPGGELVAATSALWGAIIPVLRTASERSVFDPAARAVSLGYGAFTPRSLRALRFTAARGAAALSEVRCPTLIIQSTTDNRISSAATKRAFDKLAASDKRLDWIEGAGHVITVDFGWERVVERAVAWMDDHRPKRKPGPPTGAPAGTNA